MDEPINEGDDAGRVRKDFLPLSKLPVGGYDGALLS